MKHSDLAYWLGTEVKVNLERYPSTDDPYQSKPDPDTTYFIDDYMDVPTVGTVIIIRHTYHRDYSWGVLLEWDCLEAVTETTK